MKKSVKKKTFEKKIFFIIISIISIFSLSSFVSASGNLILQPSNILVNPGEQFNITVQVDNIIDLYGFQLNVNYDSSIINYTGMEEGDFLKNDGATTFLSPPNSSTLGLLKNLIITRISAANGVTGNGILAKLEFRALNTGSSAINISNDKLIDSNINEITHNINNANVLVADNIYPAFSSYTENPNNPATYISGQTYNFNAAISNTNGNAGIELNGKNYSGVNSLNIFTVTINNLGAGIYSYYWWAYGNGTDHLFNKSSIISYAVNKAPLTGNLASSSGWNINYGTSTIISSTENNQGDSDVIYKIYRDNIDKGAGETVILGAGTYYYKLNSTGGGNYSQNSNINSQILTVNQASGSGTLLLNGLSSDIIINYPSRVNASFKDLTGTVTLFRNGIDVTSLNNMLEDLPVNYYNFTLIVSGNQNYTSFSITRFANITKASSQTSLTFDKTSPQDYPASIIPACSKIKGQGIQILQLDGTTISAGNPVTLSAGTHIFNCSLSASQNYTYSENISTFTINKANSQVYTYLNNSRANITINLGDSIWLNSSRITGEGAISLYNQGVLINQGSGNIKNLTVFNSVGIFNITTIYQTTQNYTTSFETFWVNVLPDNIYPKFSNYEDNNRTLIGNGTALFNITVDNTNGTVLLEINNANYTTSLNSGKYTSAVYLLNGIYNYKWISWGNGINHNLNSSNIRSYTVLDFLLEDINMDTRINLQDILLAASYVGRADCSAGNNRCDRRDVNNDSRVDIIDLVRIAKKIS